MNRLVKISLAIFLSLFVFQHCLAEDALRIQAYIPQKKFSIPGKRVVLVGGCFDILHYGHIEFLKKSKKEGDILIVALESDERILHSKNRIPIHTQNQRAHNLQALRCVDKVLLLPAMNGFEDYDQLVKNVQPATIAITSDDPMIEKKKIQANAIGAKLKIVMDRIEDFASSKFTPRYHRIFKGIVLNGKKEAGTLNYPTANIQITEKNLEEGVYSCNIFAEEKLHKGMCYFDNRRSNILEAHLFEYQGNLYGKEIIVGLNRFIRKPKLNISLEEVKQLIQNDVKACCEN